MQNLLEILLEARLDLRGDLLQKVKETGFSISIKYKGQWIKDVVIKSIEKRGKDQYIKATVTAPSGKKTSQEFKVKDITDWSETEFRKQQLKTIRKKPEAEPEEEPGKAPKKGAKVSIPPGEISKRILDCIVNRRPASVYYKGDKENEAGWRRVVPVTFGQRSTKKYGLKNYVRVWQYALPNRTLTTIPAWKMFRLDRIKAWEIGNAAIDSLPAGIPRYNPNDSEMSKIYKSAVFENKKRKGSKKSLKEQLVQMIENILNS